MKTLYEQRIGKKPTNGMIWAALSGRDYWLEAILYATDFTKKTMPK